MKKAFCMGKEFILFFTIIFCGCFASGQTVFWDGGGGDNRWNNPLNWSNDVLPGLSSAVVLDQSAISSDYLVLIDSLTTAQVRTLYINPGPGHTIEVRVPVANRLQPALVAAGPGYGLILGQGSIFRNASGLVSGQTLQIADSIRIENGGRYIHQTRSSHAASIVQLLSRSAGTEAGEFEFNIPTASSTLSLSNRTFGKLILSASANGGAVTYTSLGSNPVRIRNDFMIMPGVSMNTSIADTLWVRGNFIQQGGSFNLGSSNSATVLHLQGNLEQDTGSVITETGSAEPGIVFGGQAPQHVHAAGVILNSVGIALNNSSGLLLDHSLYLPYRLTLLNGVLHSSPDSLLILGPSAFILADSNQAACFINGPVKKEGLNGPGNFLFPVGKANKQRWINLKQATGTFTVEYFPANPRTLSSILDTGIKHISGLEYWKVLADRDMPGEAAFELSFDNVNSGGVTDLMSLRVAALDSLTNVWNNAGNTGVTGSPGVSGSVTSLPRVFSNSNPSQFFTLASALAGQNPLPLHGIRLTGKRQVNGFATLEWNCTDPVRFSHAELQQSGDGRCFLALMDIGLVAGLNSHRVSLAQPGLSLLYFRIKAIDKDGMLFYSNTVVIKTGTALLLEKAFPTLCRSILNLEVIAGHAGDAELWFSDAAGRLVMKKKTTLCLSRQRIAADISGLPGGVYLVFICQNGVLSGYQTFIRW